MNTQPYVINNEEKTIRFAKGAMLKMASYSFGAYFLDIEYKNRGYRFFDSEGNDFTDKVDALSAPLNYLEFRTDLK
jgi:hypothetical protein